MAIDGLTLGFLIRELNEKLLGGRIDKISQPFRDMLILSVRNNGENFRLLISPSPACTRMHLTDRSYENPREAPMFLMLMRKHVQGGRITEIAQLNGDRFAQIAVSGMNDLGDPRDMRLYFEAMGRHTNLSLVENGRIIDCMRHVTPDQSRVRTLLPGLPYEMPPAQDKLNPEALSGEDVYARLSGFSGPLARALSAHICGLSAQTAQEIALRIAGDEDASVQDLPDIRAACEQLSAFFRHMPALMPPCLKTDQDGAPCDILPFPYQSLPESWQKEGASLSALMDDLYFEKDRRDRMAQRLSQMTRNLKNAASRAENKLAANREELQGAEKAELFRISGELLTAFSADVPRGAEEVRLPNYYDENRPFSIALEPGLSPAANAQKYFKKYRKANVARKMATEQIQEAEKEIALIGEALFALEQIERESELSAALEPLYEHHILKRPREARKKGKAPEAGKPLRYRSPDGLPILVGRNSLQNEQLLQGAAGDDLWLHAKDRHGAHVIVEAGGRPVPDETVLCAARLAAYYASGSAGQADVDYTLRRHVKKVKDAPRGFVAFTNQKTLRIAVSRAIIDAIPREESR